MFVDKFCTLFLSIRNSTRRYFIHDDYGFQKNPVTRAVCFLVRFKFLKCFQRFIYFREGSGEGALSI